MQTGRRKRALQFGGTPDQGQVLSIVLHRDKVLPAAAPVVAQAARAHFTFGSGGTSRSFACDVGTGLVLALPAESVSVELENLGTEALRIAAMASYQSQSGNQGQLVTLTFDVGAIVVGAPVIVPVPDFARRVRFFRAPFATSGYTLEFLDTALGLLYEREVAVGGDIDTTEIANGAAAVRIDAVAANITAGVLVFYLAF